MIASSCAFDICLQFVVPFHDMNSNDLETGALFTVAYSIEMYLEKAHAGFGTMCIYRFKLR